MVDFPNSLRDSADPSEKPAAIALTAADTGDGIRVVIVSGECFGSEIEWYGESESEETVTVSTDPQTGLPMLSYPLPGGSHATYRGLEADGLTWWRYAHEVDPNAYREHCLRVVRRL